MLMSFVWGVPCGDCSPQLEPRPSLIANQLSAQREQQSRSKGTPLFFTEGPSFFYHDLVTIDLNMELYWYIVVIIFIVIKIFFYVCWYRSRQRQLAAYLNNPRNSQIVIVGGRAYVHQMCERQNTSIWPSWYGVQDEGSVGEPSASLPTAASFSHLDMPPPYEAVSGADDLKPPPYSEVAQSDDFDASRHASLPLLPPPLFEGEDSASIISEAPPPYTPSPNRQEGPVNPSQSHSEDRPS
ncbi:uncharacterized protein LOC121570185 [Coregonus clupeaformis]|uniref:uncharacterized protein LOC121570185 n=1 Tax=Coregonus clupeaformis TaxID=59861 RepID=UPI001BE0B7C9|nr:uncharacterized protein LOC121570185 [Coregonus clupeaformis]